MIDLLHKEITYSIRGACFTLWNQFGGAFKESVVDKSLSIELRNRGHKVEDQKRIDILYSGEKVGTYVPDKVIDDKVLVEMKCKEHITKGDINQFWKYLKGTNYKVGLLINFGPHKLDIRRVVYDSARAEKVSALNPRSQSASHPRDGFTVIEIIVVAGISGIIVSALLWFIATAYPLSKITYLQQRSTETARLQLKRMSKILREARPSATGAYPLVEMAPQRVVFYSDIDADATTERVRYELIDTDLVRGVTEPSGTPLAYNVADEQVSTIAANVRNDTVDVFTYYTGDYPADQTPLTPVDLTEVKYIQFQLIIDADPAHDPPPIDVLSQVQLRNLKTNLGQSVEE